MSALLLLFSIADAIPRDLAAGEQIGNPIAQAAEGAPLDVAGSDPWRVLSPYPAPASLSSVAFGEGRFVAAGNYSLIHSDGNGTAWQEGTGFRRIPYAAVAYGNGRFVAVGTGGEAAVSEDGKSWTMHPIGSSMSLLTLQFGNGVFVAAGKFGVLAVSSDGESWDRPEPLTTAALRTAAFGNGHFLILAERPGRLRFLVSQDGRQWSEFTPALGGRVLGLAHTGTHFAAQVLEIDPLFEDRRTRTMISVDGAEWQPLGGIGPVPEDIQAGDALDFVNGRFIFFATETAAYHSSDAADWAPFTLPPHRHPLSRSFPRAAHGNGRYVIAGTAVFEPAGPGLGPMLLEGPSLAALERVDRPAPQLLLTDIAADGNTIAALCPGSVIDPNGAKRPAPFLVSTNGGETFEPVDVPDSVSFSAGGMLAIHFAQGKFVSVGQEGAVLRSADGLNWSKRISNTTSKLWDVTFGNDLWVAVGADGKIITSPDASLFQPRASGTELVLNAVDFGGGQFIAVGKSGLILKSADGISWSRTGTEETMDFLGIAYGNGLWVALGSDNQVYTSLDGSDWAAHPRPGGAWISIAFAEGTFVAVQLFSRNAYLSENGVDWRLAPASQDLFGAEASGSKLWITGTSAYIAHYIPPAGQIRVAASVNSEGRLILNVAVPAAGTYKIEAASEATGAWETVAEREANALEFSWTDPSPLAGMRFYRVSR